jgi:uncharacterized BrkB/YihY/UPF0761 family membrane protein
VANLSHTQKPAEAFLFPRLISTVFVVLALWTFVEACLGWTNVGNGISVQAFTNLLPGMIVAVIYIFWTAKGLGFYTATTIAFFILYSLYDPEPHSALKSWIRRAVVTACFMAVMYGLFALLLEVYTPREVLF